MWRCNNRTGEDTPLCLERRSGGEVRPDEINGLSSSASEGVRRENHFGHLKSFCIFREGGSYWKCSAGGKDRLKQLE